jgi:hypothetical protein
VSELPFDELLGSCTRTAAHLELRDVYMTDAPAYVDWQEGRGVDGAAAYRDWFDVARHTVARGVHLRRLRVICDPVSDYIRFEHSITGELNVAAGEQVRWLPRRRANGLLLPANDLWLLDDQRVRFGYFGADGSYLGSEIVEDEGVVANCVTAFNAAWRQATDHQDFILP